MSTSAGRNMKPKVQFQGKAVAERDVDGYLVMLPDGQVEHRATKPAVEKLVKAWFADHVEGGAIGVGQIEWRE